MILLPEPPTRPALRGFWLTLVSAVGVGLLVSPALHSRGGLLGGIVGTAAVAALGWVRPRRIVEPVYVRWSRLARLCGRAAQFWISGCIFFVVFVAVGREGSELNPGSEDPQGPEGSGWWPRPSTPASYASEHGRVEASGERPNWLRSVGRWARGSGNLWIWGLVPFLAILRILEPREHRSLGEKIYTLY